MTTRLPIALLTLFGLFLAACEDEDDECPDCICDCCEGDDDAVGDDDDDDAAAECSEDTECDDWQICEANVCVDGDRNNDFAEALGVAAGDEPGGYINPAGDVDYFRLGGDQGWFFKAYAMTADPTDDQGLDTVVRFYDGSGHEKGYNDDFDRLGHIYGTDALYMGCTAASETYYLSVEDYGSFINDPAQMEGGAGYIYQLFISDFEAGSVEDEPNDDAGDATDLAITDYNVSYDRAGVVGDDGDVDLWAVDLEPGARFRVYGYEHTATEIDLAIRMLGTDGTSQAGAFGAPSWSDYISFPVLDDAPVYMEVADDDGDGGDEYCYVLHFAADPAGELYWAETEPNDDNFSSEALQANDDGVLAVAGRIDPMGDLDHFLFQGTTGQQANVSLAARTAGSSLEAHVRVVSPGDVELISLNVMASEGTVIQALDLPESGTYHLEVTSSDELAGGVDQWYVLELEVN